jgi:flagellar biosynthesis component FlhA
MEWAVVATIIFLLCWGTWLMDVLKWLFIFAAAIFPLALVAIVGFFVIGGILGFLGIPKSKKKKEESKTETRIEPKKSEIKLESKPIPKPEKIEAETKKVDETVKESEALLRDIEKFLETSNP